jgi:predicted molibdopterin-dependent oxidoreductase YjgC
MSYRALQGEGRLTQPLVRGTDEFVRTTWAAALEATVARLRAANRVGIVVSAHAPNEEVHLLRRLATGGARLAGIAWSPPGAFHDDFLIKADKNPNTQGLRLQGVPLDAETLFVAAGRGELDALVLHRVDATAWRDAAATRAALERVPCLIVLDPDLRETAQYADVVLPLATYAETDGTFTNHAGRVQRFLAAVRPPGEARPGWQVLSDVLAAFGAGDPPASAADVFAALVADRPAYHGLAWDALGDEGAPAAGT